MGKSVFKYLLVLTVLLMLGEGLAWGHTARAVIADKDNKQQEFSISRNTSDHIFSVMMETFSTIRQVEILEACGRGQGVESYRFITIYPKISAVPSAKNVDLHNYMHLLSERHYQGFYVYTLKKLII